MYIQLFDLIDDKKSCNITDLNKNLSVIPSLFLDNFSLDIDTNNNSKKYKYVIVKPDKDNDCIHDEIYMKLFDDIKSNYHIRNDNKTTRRAKKAIKENISRKNLKLKNLKLKNQKSKNQK